MSEATRSPSNIVLIGMPGAGKSTVGVILAKQTSRDFVDTDVLIQTRHGRSLQDVVDTDGHMTLRKIEEDVILSMDVALHVIATGGSAVYSDAAMDHLKSDGVAVFLDVDLGTIAKRIRDFDTRGIARAPDQSLEDLFDERHALYVKYADITIGCTGMDQDEICRAIRDRI
jgi:shikimate kinase